MLITWYHLPLCTARGHMGSHMEERWNKAYNIHYLYVLWSISQQLKLPILFQLSKKKCFKCSILPNLYIFDTCLIYLRWFKEIQQPWRTFLGTTVLDYFVNAVAKYEVSLKVRTECGKENDEYLMTNLFRGSGRQSSIQRASTLNQRTDALWGDVWGLFEIFNFLESQAMSDTKIKLHYVYIPRIDRCLTFRSNQWNRHGLVDSEAPVTIADFC